MNKKMKLGLWIIGVVFIAIIILFATGIIKLQTALSSTFTPVYCNDYEEIRCVENNKIVTKTISLSSPYTCPATSLGCLITEVRTEYLNRGLYIYYGSQNCRVVKDWTTLWFSTYKCDDQKQTPLINGITSIDIPKGYFIWGDGDGSIKVTELGEKLVLGTGVTIKSGSCSITASSGQTITDGNINNLGTSYVVPLGEGILSWNLGNRHICGNLEEQCNLDSDCIGHTYGTKECYARTLQTYGCTQLNLPSGLTEKNGEIYAPLSLDATKVYSGVTSRCEIISAKSVQCCGDTDCGSNMFCDKTSFTCKATTTCTQNSDCGVSKQCDYSTKTLKTPICSLGQCDYKKQAVECCSDVNCPDEFFCNSNYKCEEKPVVKVACIFECCDRDTGYFDKACPSNEYCVAHSCESTPECKTDDECKDGYECKNSKCVEVNEQICEDRLGGLIIEQIGVKEECSFWCQVGLKQPEKINVCVRDYTPLFITLFTTLALAFLFVWGRKKKGKGKASAINPDNKNWYENKFIWLALGILLAIGLIIGYFKYVFWGVITLALLGLLYVLIRIFVFKKIW